MSNWWAQRLGTPQPAAPQPMFRGPSTAPIQPGYTPPEVHGQYHAPQTPPKVNGQNLGEVIAMGIWEGPATKTQTQRCPKCGDNNFFTDRTGGDGWGIAPAPQCYGCGYTPSKYAQSADQPRARA